jgi:hypothetical protein
VLRIVALSAAPPVRSPASTQPTAAKHLTTVRRLTEFTVLRRRSAISENNGGEFISSRRGAFVFDVQLVRTLCQEITEGQDPPRVEELLHLLQAVIKDDQEEVRLRMSFLTRKYAAVVSDSKAAD